MFIRYCSCGQANSSVASGCFSCGKALSGVLNSLDESLKDISTAFDRMKERREHERAEQERAEHARLARAEAERLQREAFERERLAREEAARLERERLAQERLERERLAELKSTFQMEGDTLVRYNGRDKNVTIPSFVKCIGRFAFSGKDIASITIPNSVTEIEHNAFDGCNYLKSITIPNSVTSIGRSAFGNCRSLESINIPAKVKEIEENVFYSCTSLKSIYYQGDLAGWCRLSGHKYVLSNNRTLYIGGKKLMGNVVIPNGIMCIDDFAFRNCEGITSLTIPDSVESIGENAFCYCTGLTSVRIGRGVTEIGDRAFCGCTNLRSVGFEKGSHLYRIGWHAFLDCVSLTEIVIPLNVMEIEPRVFSGCSRVLVMCETKSKPKGWDPLWKKLDLRWRQVLWGYDGSEKKRKKAEKRMLKIQKAADKAERKK